MDGWRELKTKRKEATGRQVASVQSRQREAKNLSVGCHPMGGFTVISALLHPFLPPGNTKRGGAHTGEVSSRRVQRWLKDAETVCRCVEDAGDMRSSGGRAALHVTRARGVCFQPAGKAEGESTAALWLTLELPLHLDGRAAMRHTWAPAHLLVVVDVGFRDAAVQPG